MRYTHCTTAGAASIQSKAGAVVFNGATLLPHEAAMLGDALVDCAQHAEKLADIATAQARTQRGDGALVLRLTMPATSGAAA